ncbi:MAG: hypothetical protein ABIQ75_05140 [Flavobacteriales bacterium]
MRSSKYPVAIAALVLAGLATTSCTNRNGAGGTSDGTSAEGYELRSEKNLAPPMDSMKATAVDSTFADTANHVSK